MTTDSKAKSNADVVRIREQQDRRRFEAAQYGKVSGSCVADIDTLLDALATAQSQLAREVLVEMNEDWEEYDAVMARLRDLFSRMGIEVEKE